MPSATQRTPDPSSQAGPSSPRKRPPPPDTSAFTYNPRQDADDRRRVRSDYRALIARAEESKRDSSLKPADLVDLISQVDELHERVVAPSESVLDTKTLTSMSEMGARMAKKMKLNADAFDTHEFVSRIARYVGGEAAAQRRTARGDSDDEDDEAEGNVNEWDWAKLGRLAASVSRRAVTMDFLLGPLDTVPKTRKSLGPRRVEDAPAERQAPRALGQQDLQQSAGRESTSAIIKVSQLLKQQGPQGVCLFRFAVDPHSFVNTIENFFHVSFLIKENKASLTTDREGNAILATAQPPSEDDESQADSTTRSKQFIMEIDYPTYLESIQLYDLRESVIPTRPNRVDPLSGLEALARGSASQEIDASGSSSSAAQR
ncbi:Non-structural maintenance of chromosome element 4, C-terminal [Kalmanozyma brasiliensis GHG001]|uniref:Non-structural maintenance of chromosomes element 4 n=1 Tax=Kalmanozyma brasiliensis (strain GHG001) TaxID=1365824 RepID=V5ECD1_KALBG|nr:Non-structural maintenance of chromosome element 4, C-terminal [Kalmanozyma brasiliensis GHG001]EST08061.1 Non-structural maintenance of chromosome element 4, C-terminal [Kalmanozyma brasiliensis GHG001]